MAPPRVTRYLFALPSSHVAKELTSQCSGKVGSDTLMELCLLVEAKEAGNQMSSAR